MKFFLLVWHVPVLVLQNSFTVVEQKNFCLASSFVFKKMNAVLDG
jgi:hypothetical protein